MTIEGAVIMRKKPSLAAGASILIIGMIMLISNSMAYCSICERGTENWIGSAESFLNDSSTVQTVSGQSTTPLAIAATAPQSVGPDLQRGAGLEEVLIPVSSIAKAVSSSTRAGRYGYDVVMDVSPEANEIIKGAISLPYDKFINNGSLRSVSEVAKILGDAGISEHSSVLIYGQCLPCGVNSAYVYWVMKYLGHEKVKILDGGIDDWVAAKLPTATTPSVLQKTNYTPKINPGLLATYDYVLNGNVQIIDARSFQDYGLGYIQNARNIKARNIPYDQVMDNGRFKSQADLSDLFFGIDRAKPVVVYSNTGTQAGSVWFALESLGYSASLYSWQNWVENQPRLNLEIVDIRADPNPATTGSQVKITALFGTAKKVVGTSSAAAVDANKTILKTKGCATCGFGSPQGFANINTSSGVAQLGNSGQNAASQSGVFSCVANVIDTKGSVVGRAIMKQMAGDWYSGIWNANVEAGNYSVNIAVSASRMTKTFEDALKIAIVGVKGYQQV
jgi:thiosulfate/3-mercaptopyruvate sulfurtransferase